MKQEVRELLALAESADRSELPESMSVPAEIARREDQLAAIAKAKAKIEARSSERCAREKAEFDAKLRARADKTAKTGRSPLAIRPRRPAKRRVPRIKSTSPMTNRAS